MRRLVFLSCFVVVLLAACTQQEIPDPVPFSTLDAHRTTELFISEYVEGSSNNKALEIFNGTDSTVDLAEYRVEMYFNGNLTAGLTIDLVGELQPGNVFVLAHSSADGAILETANLTSGSGFFNGDDTILLLRSGSVVDSFGQLGTDPGDYWESGGATTKDRTLRREVCTGDVDPTNSFDPSNEWNASTEDDFSDLGSHFNNCDAGPHAEPPEPSPEPDPNQIVPIFEVQGDGASSPFAGQTLTIEGVVVGDFQQYGSLGGFFVEETKGDGLEGTSDGIFVYHYSTAVSVGDKVRVRGTVDEYFGLTELTDVEEVKLIGNFPHEPISVTLPLAEGVSWERYEGMSITLDSSHGELVATEVYHLGRGGVVMLAGERIVQYTQTNEPSKAGYEAHVESLERRTILLDDGTTDQNPDPIEYSTTGGELTAEHTLRVGDTTESVTGVVTYSYSGWGGTDAYRIHPTEEVDFVASNPRPQDPPQVGGRIQVASFNVLNFFNGDGKGGGFPTPRGAYTQYEYERQLDKLVSAIVPIDAEVLGLIEIENDGGRRGALSDLVDALNEEAGAGTYEYIETGSIGTDEIKVALIYQPAEVSPVGDYGILNSTHSNRYYTSDPRFDDSKNRPALAQTFAEVESGEGFTVIVNHLKSKGSPCSERDAGDGQGNCNETRADAAEALAGWAEQLARTSGDDDVLIMGDLNAYAMEDPIDVLRAAKFENLLDLDEFTYVFAGESGTLDHALATPSLASQVTAADVWSINAEEPSVLDYSTAFKSDNHVDLLYSDSPFRASDHDPVVIGLNLN